MAWQVLGRAAPLALVGSLMLAACGESELSRETVTSLPEGDATGTALSGRYTMELLTTDCNGVCPKLDFGWITYTPCKVGHTFSGWVDVTQSDGRLEVKVSGGFFVKVLLGGVSSSGAFDVGGYTLDSGSSHKVDITARVKGTMDTTKISGDVKANGLGDAYGQEINCLGMYTLSGTRK